MDRDNIRLMAQKVNRMNEAWAYASNPWRDALRAAEYPNSPSAPLAYDYALRAATYAGVGDSEGAWFASHEAFAAAEAAEEGF